MIGEIELPGGERAQLQDNGRWSCKDKKMEDVLNANFLPKGKGVEAILPYGFFVVEEAAHSLEGKVIKTVSVKTDPNKIY